MHIVDSAKEWLRGIYGANPAIVDRMAAEDVVVSYPIFEKLFDTSALAGREMVRQFAEGFCRRWAETRLTFHESITEGRRVVLIWSFEGKNVASTLDNVPPTNEVHKWGGITLIRFNAEGKITAEIGEESEPGPIGRLVTANS